MTKEPARTWIEYWDRDDFWCGSRLWEVNHEVFLRRVCGVVSFGHDDVVCDIGCGPGHFERRLAPRVKEIVALDTSERFVELCRRNCREHDNVSALVLGEDYTDLSVCGQKFSLFLCVSVVQYYNDPVEIEALVRSAREVAEPGARMLIADLPLKRSAPGFVWDALCTAGRSVAGGYAADLFGAACRYHLRGAEYRAFSRAHDVLKFMIADIRAMIERMGLDAAIIRRSLSVYANRPSILIRL